MLAKCLSQTLTNKFNSKSNANNAIKIAHDFKMANNAPPVGSRFFNVWILNP